MSSVRCPNKDCNTKMNILDHLLHNPNVNVKCPSCKKMFKPFETLSQILQDEILNNKKKNEEIEQATAPAKSLRKNDKQELVVGWIVVHDEQTHTQTYELKLGRQLIGRSSVEIKCDIPIETPDLYMHRTHFYLTVSKKNNAFCYLIESHMVSVKGNGTYIDTRRLNEYEREVKRLKAGEEVYLEDGALIQAGRTKIILKTLQSVSNREDATRIVSQERITKTIIL